MSSETSRVQVSCGICNWSCWGSKQETVIQTMKHYGVYHSIPGWIYRKYQSITEKPESDPYPRCDYCTLPAVCVGAGMVSPMNRCPRCCREYQQLGGHHGADEYLEAHLEAEGIGL